MMCVHLLISAVRVSAIRPRDVVVVLTLVSHLMSTIGFPLPAFGRTGKDLSRPFPCQNRPCGCLNADQCWKGDCCCFTLEDKFEWALANGMEVPEHVRPLVESRKKQPPPPAKRSCCEHNHDDATTDPNDGAADDDDSSCCREPEGADVSSCCRKAEVSKASSGCTHCSPKPGGKKPKAPDRDEGVQWIVGLVALKCRGEGPSDLSGLEPCVVADEALPPADAPPEFDSVPSRTDRCEPLPFVPPTPPPRHS